MLGQISVTLPYLYEMWYNIRITCTTMLVTHAVTLALFEFSDTGPLFMCGVWARLLPLPQFVWQKTNFQHLDKVWRLTSTNMCYKTHVQYMAPINRKLGWPLLLFNRKPSSHTLDVCCSRTALCMAPSLQADKKQHFYLPYIYVCALVRTLLLKLQVIRPKILLHEGQCALNLRFS